MVARKVFLLCIHLMMMGMMEVKSVRRMLTCPILSASMELFFLIQILRSVQDRAARSRKLIGRAI
jgi:hypothetical protein